MKQATAAAKSAQKRQDDEDAEDGSEGGEVVEVDGELSDEQPEVVAKKPAKQETRVILHGINAAIEDDDTLTVLSALEDLEAGDIQVKYDNNFNIISCSVTVKNVGSKEQRGIAIVFNFKDNSKIVAEGPVTLFGGEEGVYEFPTDLLPFSLRQKYRTQNISDNKLTKKQIKEKLTPNVTVGL